MLLGYSSPGFLLTPDTRVACPQLSLALLVTSVPRRPTAPSNVKPGWLLPRRDGERSDCLALSATAMARTDDRHVPPGVDCVPNDGKGEVPCSGQPGEVAVVGASKGGGACYSHRLVSLAPRVRASNELTSFSCRTIFVFATSLIMFGVWENGQDKVRRRLGHGPGVEGEAEFCSWCRPAGPSSGSGSCLMR